MSNHQFLLRLQLGSSPSQDTWLFPLEVRRPHRPSLYRSSTCMCDRARMRLPRCQTRCSKARSPTRRRLQGMVRMTIRHADTSHGGSQLSDSVPTRAPRSDPSQAARSDVGDVAGPVSQRFGRKHDPRAEVDAGQTLQQRHRPAFPNSSLAVDHEISLKTQRVAATEQRKRHTGVPSDVLHSSTLPNDRRRTRSPRCQPTRPTLAGCRPRSMS